MPTIASTMPSNRLSPRQVSRKRPRLWRMSFSARFTSRPAGDRTRRAACTQIGAIVHDDLALHLGRDLDPSIKQPLAELHAAPREPAILQDPDHAGAAIIALDELERNEETAGNHLLDDFDFRLLAQITELVLRIADPAADVHAPFF